MDLSSDKSGAYLWSIYSLIPESVLGTAEWEYAPALSSRSPVFQFTFDMEYTKISAICDNGSLVEFNYGDGKGNTITFPAGQPISWSPVSDKDIMADQAVIRFTVYYDDDTFYIGTIYIEATEDTQLGRIYKASLSGTGLHLEQNTEWSGGVISHME